MQAEFVRWECGCEGIHLPDNNEDVIIHDCRDGGTELRFSRQTKTKRFSRSLKPTEVVDLIHTLSGLTADGERFREIKLLLGSD